MSPYNIEKGKSFLKKIDVGPLVTTTKSTANDLMDEINLSVLNTGSVVTGIVNFITKKILENIK